MPKFCPTFPVRSVREELVIDSMSEHGQDCGCFECRRERKRAADLASGEEHADLSAGLPSPKEEARALLALKAAFKCKGYL